MSDKGTHAQSVLHLIVPGICGPLAETDSLQSEKVLNQWISTLSKAKQSDSANAYFNVLKSILRLDDDIDFPAASLSLLANGRYDASMFYLHADPVHLEADMDHAILTSAEDLNISDEEKNDLIATLNQHFAQDDLCFTAKDNNQWYVSSKNKIELSTTSLRDATGRNINFLLPTGADSSHWKKLLTEAQMLMFSHEVNDKRESNRQQSINSLWFHGAGDLANLNLQVGGNGDVDSICSNQDMLKGLAEKLGISYCTVPSSARLYEEYLLENKDSSVNVLHLTNLEHLVNYTDVQLWLEQLSMLLESWVYPLLKTANRNNIKVILYPCNKKQYLFLKYDGLRFWRHGKLEQYVDSY